MLEPMTKTIDGYNVVFYPIGALKVACLDKKVASLIAPFISAFNPDDLDKEVDFKSISGIISSALGSLNDDDLVSLIVSSLKGCTITAPGKVPVEVNDGSVIDNVFQGAVEVMYKVVFEAWRFNKLTPFVLLERIGLKIPKIDSYVEQKGTQRTGGLKLAK